MKISKSIRRSLAPLILLAAIALLSACQPDATPTPSVEVLPAPGEQSEGVAGIGSLALEQALPPVRLVMPDLNLDLPVAPMGWQVVGQDDQRTTEWITPEDAVGWFVNSAGAGGAGATILSGHQAQGDRVFAPLAMGDIDVGQEIRLTDEEGQTFIYRVVDVSQPIPIGGATADEQAIAESFVEPGSTARLVLITGWPDFTTTHRIFVNAEFAGLMK